MTIQTIAANKHDETIMNPTNAGPMIYKRAQYGDKESRISATIHSNKGIVAAACHEVDEYRIPAFDAGTVSATISRGRGLSDEECREEESSATFVLSGGHDHDEEGINVGQQRGDDHHHRAGRRRSSKHFRSNVTLDGSISDMSAALMSKGTHGQNDRRLRNRAFTTQQFDDVFNGINQEQGT